MVDTKEVELVVKAGGHGPLNASFSLKVEGEFQELKNIDLAKKK